jgi:hypothetical protein
MNNSAQMNVLEAVLVVGMLFLSMYFVSTIEVSFHTTVEEENNFEILARGILKSLGDESDSSGNYNSLLAKYISDIEGDPDSNSKDMLRTYIRSVFPEGTMFTILKVNYSKIIQNASATLSDCTDYIGPNYGFWMNDAARASRIVVADGFVYEIIISVWFNLRR